MDVQAVHKKQCEPRHLLGPQPELTIFARARSLVTVARVARVGKATLLVVQLRLSRGKQVL